MLEEIMNYKSFQEISIHLDKTKYSLPQEAQKTIYNIKKQLDIKDIIDIRNRAIKILICSLEISFLISNIYLIRKYNLKL